MGKFGKLNVLTPELRVNSIDQLKFQLTFRLRFQLSFVSTIVQLNVRSTCHPRRHPHYRKRISENHRPKSYVAPHPKLWPFPGHKSVTQHTLLSASLRLSPTVNSVLHAVAACPLILYNYYILRGWGRLYLFRWVDFWFSLASTYLDKNLFRGSFWNLTSRDLDFPSCWKSGISGIRLVEALWVQICLCFHWYWCTRRNAHFD